ncbi:beta strand repeat-containing protein [Dysosmobacter sp.]|uniref:beta strand repeat-containing protein n=1 Tax=Dysosmobacter sp. TaxID=2591382 RepID=UPI003FD79722
MNLTVSISSAASGELSIEAKPIDGDTGNIANADLEDVPVTFVPGTITVKADTSDRTVTFMNGTEAAATETVANGGKLTEIPAAPAAVDDQSFLGWYAVEGTNYVLSTVEDTITGTEASTDTVITADTTYHAIWASSAMIAAGYAADASGKTTIGVVAAISGLQNFVNSYTGGTVKLLKNVDLAKGYVVIQSGTTVTLDLNGKTLSANGVQNKATGWNGYGPIVNNGNLALISSTALTDKGVVQLNETETVSFDGYGALTNHGTVRMENIKLVSVSTFVDEDGMYAPACAYYGKEDATIKTIQDCELRANRTAALYQYSGSIGKLSDSVFEGSATMTGKPAAVFLEGWGKQQHYGTIENCTITLHCDDPDYSVAALDVKCGTLESVTGCTITGPDGILVEDFGSSDCISPEIRTLNSTVEGTNGYAIRKTPDLSSYGDTYKDRKPVINFTGGQYKGTKGAEKYEGSATITYPAGQKLVAGEDGWYTLQTAYTVTFMNGNTVLQTVTCGNNGTAVYTSSAPTKATDETYTYTFNGKWADESGNIYTGNQVTNVTSDLTVTAQFDTASAKVVTLTVDGTSKNYTGLKAAADALNASGDYKSAEIKLNENDTETEPVAVTKSVTLDLNGHDLTANTAENGITVSGGATLTFKDSVGTGVYKHTATSVEKSAILANDSGTVVNIESGTIEATKGNALKVDNAAFHVSGGTIIGGNNGIYVVTQSLSPECTISNGKIICNGNGFALNMDDAAIAGSIQLSGGAFKNTANTTELIRNQDKCAFQDGTSLAPEADTEGFYAVRVVGNYTLRLTADKTHYNAGETVTVTVSAFGNGSINSFGFTPVFDSDKLTLGKVTAIVTGGTLQQNPANGKTGYVVNSNTGIALGADGAHATALAKITFTAQADVNAATEIQLTGLEMTKLGQSRGDTVSLEAPLTVNLHDLRVTLAAGNGTVNGAASVTLYAKYGETGLYSDPARKTPAAVTAAAKDGYRLNNKTGENLWLCGDTGYASFDAINGLTFTGSKTFNLQTTQVWTVSFDTSGVVGGSLSTKDPITVDDGTKLIAANLPTPTANTGYAFTGWTAGGTAINPDAYTVKGDVTLKPVFTVQSYAFTYTQNQSTVSVTAGVEAGKATYGQNVTFTVTPNDKHIVKQVSYTVGGSGTAKTIVPENGVYTIPGAEIVGEVALEITTVPYYTVTFKAGTGTELSSKTVFTLGTGFYTDTTFAADKVTEAPTPAAQAGYRLADQSDEALWKDENGKGYTAETVKTAVFSADTVLTAQSVKTYKVTFVSADPAKATITGSLTLDAGKTITTIPAVTYTAGYIFKEWRIGGTAYASDEALKDVPITADTTVTLVAKDNSYTATLTGGAAAEITDITGITGDRAVHGTDITFKLTAKPGYKVTAVAYRINGGDPVTLTPTAGVYTIPGDAITGPVTLQLTSNETVTVTFAAGVNGSVGGTTAFILDKDGKLTADQLNAVTKTGNAGYTFKEWQIDGAAKAEDEILNTVFNADTTVTAIFDHATYSITAEGIKGMPTTATHGTNLTFTPTVNGKIVVGVTAKIGDTVVAVTKNADGSYTISGDAITGDLTITAQTVTGSWDFFDKDTYIALSADAKIAVLATGKLNTGNYLLSGEGMYWSSKYNAYVKIVGKDETAQTLTAKLAFNATVAEQVLSYSGDINGSNTVTPADGGMINDELHSVARV